MAFQNLKGLFRVTVINVADGSDDTVLGLVRFVIDPGLIKKIAVDWRRRY